MTIPQLRTWWRIKRRIISMYAAEVYVWCEWPICLLLNWFILLTSPLWIGLVYMLAFLSRAISSRKNVERDVVSGRIWFWQMFKQY